MAISAIVAMEKRGNDKFLLRAKTAITMLKGIFSGLPAVASLVEAGNKLLPAIAKLFGLE